MRLSTLPAALGLVTALGLSACIPAPPSISPTTAAAPQATPTPTPTPKPPQAASTPTSTSIPAAPPVPADQPVADGATLAGAQASTELAYDIPSGAVFVQAGATGTQNGSASAPYASISAAVSNAPSGSTIVVRAGRYHESIQVYAKTIAIQAYPNESVVIDGAEIVSGWTADNATWSAAGYLSPSPLANSDKGLDPHHPLAARPEQVFANGIPLRQVATIGEVSPATFMLDDNGRIHVGIDPAANIIEQSTLEWGIYFNHATGSALRGLTVERFATPAAKMATVRAYADDIRIENVIVRNNAYAGISVIGNNVALKNVTSEYNGQNGLHANTADDLSITKSVISNNNAEHFAVDWSAAAIKITRARRSLIADNVISGNEGNGIWYDQSALDITILRNRISDNGRSGIMIELSARATIVGNMMVSNSRYGVYVLDSSDVSIEANTILNSERGVYTVDGPRISTDTSSADHDRRYAVPPPAIPWEVKNISVRTNVIGQSEASFQATTLISTEDVTRKKSSSNMGISMVNNAFWVDNSSSTRFFSTWAVYPTSVVATNSLGQHISKFGAGSLSTTGSGPDNPFVSGAGAQTEVTPHSMGAEPLLSDETTRLLGLPSGATDFGVPATATLPEVR